MNKLELELYKRYDFCTKRWEYKHFIVGGICKPENRKRKSYKGSWHKACKEITLYKIYNLQGDKILETADNSIVQDFQKMGYSILQTSWLKSLK